MIPFCSADQVAFNIRNSAVRKDTHVDLGAHGLRVTVFVISALTSAGNSNQCCRNIAPPVHREHERQPVGFFDSPVHRSNFFRNATAPEMRVVFCSKSWIEIFPMQVQYIDVMAGLQERFVEGIHNRGWVFVSEWMRKNRQTFMGACSV
jgi:hypothetical protein